MLTSDKRWLHGAVSLALTLAGVAWAQEVEPERGPRADEVGRAGAATASASAAASDPVVTIPWYSCYRTVEETYASAEAIVDTYPHLATWNRVGESWEKVNGYGGYDMMVLRLTNAATSGPKPALFVTGAIHGTEYATAELATRFAEGMVDVYGVDADATWLLDHHEVHLMLHANPDGRKRVERSLLGRKNANRNHCPGRPGVDLNRNFDFQWRCCNDPFDQPCRFRFAGAAAASEPETRAIMEYMAALFPDARGPEPDAAAPSDTSGIYIDLHAPGRIIFSPWGHRSGPAPNAPQIRTLARKLAFFNGHDRLMTLFSYAPSGGTAMGYAYGELGVASYIFELGTALNQDCGYFESTLLPDNVTALRYALKVVRAPYVIPAGPDAMDAGVSAGAVPPGVAAGTTVTLSATLDDDRYRDRNGAEPTQAIAAGEYYVDVPPWGDDAAATAMTAADGAFDATAEDATASIDTTGWSAGRHVVFVRGKDAGGNWGAVSAVFLFIGAGA